MKYDLKCFIQHKAARHTVSDKKKNNERKERKFIAKKRKLRTCLSVSNITALLSIFFCSFTFLKSSLLLIRQLTLAVCASFLPKKCFCFLPDYLVEIYLFEFVELFIACRACFLGEM